VRICVFNANVLITGITIPIHCVAVYCRALQGVAGRCRALQGVVAPTYTLGVDLVRLGRVLVRL